MQTANQSPTGAQAEPARDAQTGDAVNGPQAGAPASAPATPQAAMQDSPTGAATTDGSSVELEAKLAEAEAKAREYYDALLRAKAETDNTRRRAQEDVSKAHKFGIENFAEAMLPVMDSLQAALSDTTSDATKVREGVELTAKQLRAAFERNKLVAIDPTGEKFDPHRHQAISAVPAPEGIAANHVVAVLQPGWMLADRVLRPALVTVAS